MRSAIVRAFLFVTCITTTAAQAADVPPIETILQSWERASSDAVLIDATFVRLKIDHLGERQKEIRSNGRFYWEAPDRAVYRVDNEVHGVWNDGLLMIDLTNQSFMAVSADEHAQAIEELKGYSQLSFFQRLSAIGAVIAATQLDNVLPLCAQIDASEVQREYELISQSHEQGILVTATPKHPSEIYDVRQVDLILDKDTFQVLAHRVLKSAQQQTVHIFTHTTTSERPKDRDELLTPDVGGLKANRTWSSTRAPAASNAQ